MSFIWHTLFLDPIYNSLVFFIDSMPKEDVGLAIICTVVLVKLIILPLSLKAIRTQIAMREIEPELARIRETYKDQREVQALKTMELFKKAEVKPFSSVLLLFIQIPIVISLYFAVSRGGGIPLPEINSTLLYSFIPNPGTANMIFLGFMDIAKKSIVLALAAGITQFLHTRLSLPKPKARAKDAQPSLKEDFTRSMHMQMQYVMPALITLVAYSISAAIALYFLVSNIMAIIQEYIVRRKGLKILPKE